jgi:hypothetical protein
MSEKDVTTVVKSSKRGAAPGERRGGRVAGTPNKRTQALEDKIKAEYPDYDPVLSMVAISQDPSTPLEMKITCHKEVAKYVHAQRKAVEIANEVELPPIKIEGIKI